MLQNAQIIRTSVSQRPRRETLPRADIIYDALHRCGIGRGDAEIAKTAIAAAEMIRRPEAMANVLQNALIEGCVEQNRRVRVLGTMDERSVVLPTMQNGVFVLASLSRPLSEIPMPTTEHATLQIEHADALVSFARLSEAMLARLDAPHVKLVALYHPENFPLPRFALGISDIARNLRKQMIGRVSLCDMQLRMTLEDVVHEILNERPEIVGVSATFGQNDILERLILSIRDTTDYRPLLVVGGSLSTLNAQHLVRGGALVAMGAGEITMCDVVRYYLGERCINEVTDICYLDTAGTVRRTPKISNRLYDDIMPELDLLEATLDQGGVMQLESSRGCSYACSFCPREHKGIWAGDAPEALDSVLPDLAAVYDERPRVARKIFLVDEEFFGYREELEVASRVKGVAEKFAAYGFRFETSSRIDQVCRHQRDKTWHVGRMKTWKHLAGGGLDRCLFGVESGVDSILARFNKKTSAAQNVLALRTLSACGVPMRCTYITFDHLMSMEELIASYRFQGRCDLILNPLLHLPEEALYEGIRDPSFVAEHTQGTPFFEQISYMLVSMECLIGSPYLAEVERRGLAGPLNLNMGRRDARFVDPAIGEMSYFSQCWIDRNFSFDYTLKSVEKITSGEARLAARGLRVTMRQKSYELLGMMLWLATGDESLAFERLSLDVQQDLRRLARFRTGDTESGPLQLAFRSLLELQFGALTHNIACRLDEILPSFPADCAVIIRREFDEWARRTQWALINAA
jgi:hypothetical protein